MRIFSTLALAGFFGALLLASDASACCHKKKAECAPVCAGSGLRARPGSGLRGPGQEALLQLQDAEDEVRLPQEGRVRPVCETVYAAPVEYAPMASPQASGQASHQGM